MRGRGCRSGRMANLLPGSRQRANRTARQRHRGYLREERPFGYNDSMTTGETIIADAEATSQPSSRPKRLPGLRLALLASILLWLACPSFSLWPLAWIGLTPLLLGV